ncbi:hypothetical protein BDBG_16043 [Blastomyces gilchristii SLH14081]|uniref:Uncharacterized protein n=1 Tax=Blastomyces gilchristii (strain SLH14081) TaxID=559298 RepID=A0A179U826_BLAGS|nr:uncharacterized protein BDBG_16043 [Blastomyces gilchristii SLH14081]OAT03327.1 hypothetical protein BDBG_16043 [Blastomyces gilchristii SLH14081]
MALAFEDRSQLACLVVHVHKPIIIMINSGNMPSMTCVQQHPCFPSQALQVRSYIHKPLPYQSRASQGYMEASYEPSLAIPCPVKSKLAHY